MTELEVAALVLDEIDNASKIKTKEPQENSNEIRSKCKMLNKMLFHFNELEILVKDNLDDSDNSMIQDIVEKLKIASKPITDALAQKNQLFSQSKLSDFYTTQCNANSEANKLNNMF